MRQSTITFGKKYVGAEPFNIDQEKLKIYKDNIPSIIKVQSLARGNLARSNFSFLKSKQMGSDKYFSLDEYIETTRNPSISLQNIQNSDI